MLRIEDLSYNINGRPLFENASVMIPQGYRIGLIGPNGSGKTTLFDVIRGERAPLSGEISYAKNTRIGGVAQEVPNSAKSLLDVVLDADEERRALLQALETAQDHNIAEIHMRLGDIDAYSAEARAAIILKGLGFSNQEITRPCSDFSGGWRMRVALAAVLFSAPDLLLLDEPTNFLDFEGTVWLESYLARYPYSMIVISHDRDLLNTSVDHILHLDQRRLTLYTGGYDAFERARAEKAAQNAAHQKKQAAKRAHLQAFVDRFRYKASKAKQAQSRLKMIERLGTISDEDTRKEESFAFLKSEELTSPILRFENASVGYDAAKPILSQISMRLDFDARIALLGANGEGKSTLSKLIAGRLAASSGQLVKSPKLRVGYFAQHSLEDLSADETPLDHMRRLAPDQPPKVLRARLARFGLGPDQAEQIVKTLSGGQRARLALLLATAHAPHLLILDEPTNHLDIESRAALIEALLTFEGAVILVSHDPYLVNTVADELWLVQEGRVSKYDGDVAQYRQLTLKNRGANPAQKSEKNESLAKPKRPKAGASSPLTALKAEVEKAEARVTKIEEILRKIDIHLSEPYIYLTENKEKRASLQAKRKEAEEGLVRAEAIWEKALIKLENSTS